MVPGILVGEGDGQGVLGDVRHRWCGGHWRWDAPASPPMSVSLTPLLAMCPARQRPSLLGTARAPRARGSAAWASVGGNFAVCSCPRPPDCCRSGCDHRTLTVRWIQPSRRYVKMLRNACVRIPPHPYRPLARIRCREGKVRKEYGTGIRLGHRDLRGSRDSCDVSHVVSLRPK